MAAGEGVDDLFDFGGDDVAAGELGIVEDAAEDALGEQVLDEHLLDGLVFEVGVDGLAAEVGEGGETLDKFALVPALVFDELHCALGDVGDALGEFGDGAVPIFVVGLAPLEEEAEHFDEFFRLLDGVVECDAAILEEEGRWGAGRGCWSGDSRPRTSSSSRLRGSLFVLGFPVAAGEIEGVEEGAVHAEGIAVFAGNRVLGDEGPVVLAGAVS